MNTREVALLIWAILFLIYLLKNQSTRESLGRLIKSLFSPKLISIFTCMVVYVSGIVYGLFTSGLWDFSQLKNTIVWLVSVGFVSLFDVTKSDKVNYLREALKDIFKFTAIVEFIVGLYTFHLAIELIIVPLSVLIIAMSAISKTDSKYEPVRKLLDGLLAGFGLFLILYSIYKIVNNFSGFAVTGTLSDFLIPPALSLLFIPFIYMLSIYVNYDDVFIGINRRITKPALIRFAKAQALLHFNINKTDLKRWRNSLYLRKTRTKEEIIKSIWEIKELRKIEKNPPIVPFNIGWSPYIAKDFLKDLGLLTGYYQSSFEDEWFANSEYLKLKDSSIVPNNIAYYINGTRTTAKEIKLVLNINSPDSRKSAHEKLSECAKLLYRYALNNGMPDSISQALDKGKDETVEVGNRIISVNKKLWQGHRLNGYCIEFCIRVSD